MVEIVAHKLNIKKHKSQIENQIRLSDQMNENYMGNALFIDYMVTKTKIGNLPI